MFCVRDPKFGTEKVNRNGALSSLPNGNKKREKLLASV